MKKVVTINQKLQNLWNNASPTETFGRMPTSFLEPTRSDLVIVGMNPSFSVRAFAQLEKVIPEFKAHTLHDFYAHPQTAYYNEAIEQRIAEHFKANYSYFNRFHDIQKNLNLVHWEHVDLFHVRETNQRRVVNTLYPKNEPTHFALEQLKLTKQFIDDLSPKLILVANAKASHLMLRHQDIFGISGFDNDKGCYFHGEVPVFFASMLTGQRAMDVFSYERLVWQMKQQLSNQ